MGERATSLDTAALWSWVGHLFVVEDKPERRDVQLSDSLSLSETKSGQPAKLGLSSNSVFEFAWAVDGGARQRRPQLRLDFARHFVAPSCMLPASAPP